MSVKLTDFLLFVVTFYLVVKLSRVGRREKGLPPGPPTLPLLGNAHQIPVSKGHLTLTEFARRYGDVYSLKAGSSNIVVVSSASAAQELLDKRGAISANRPTFHSPTLVTGGKYLPIMKTGGTNFKNIRKAVSLLLNGKQQEYHRSIQHQEVLFFMIDLARSPENFYMHIYRASTSIILTILYGKRVDSYDSPICHMLEDYLRTWSEYLLPGTIRPMDFLPSLEYLPGWMPWHRKVRQIRELQSKAFASLYDELEECLNLGQEEKIGCFMQFIRSRKEELGMKTRDDLVYFAGGLVDGGGDTSAAFIRSIVLMLVAYPEVQEKLFKEIDTVVGDQLPALKDNSDLPYLQAFISEIHRFRPIAPLGLPHATTKDQEYKGYFIPKGTMIISNYWGASYDTSVGSTSWLERTNFKYTRPKDFYESPEQFRPERYIEHELGLKPGVDATGYRLTQGFGHGRRMCPGVHMAAGITSLVAMYLVWTFRFDEAKDPTTGAKIPVDVNDYQEGLSTAPAPFKCEITPRSDAKIQMIENAIAAT